jgi:hypothetical protein
LNLEVIFPPVSPDVGPLFEAVGHRGSRFHVGAIWVLPEGNVSGFEAADFGASLFLGGRLEALIIEGETAGFARNLSRLAAITQTRTFEHVTDGIRELGSRLFAPSRARLLALTDLSIGSFDERDLPPQIAEALVWFCDGDPSLDPFTWTRSRLAQLLAAAARDQPSGAPYPAGAELLREFRHERATDLDRLVTHWWTQRIWAPNLVPELVVHDERHAEAVDRLLMQICRPLVLRGKLSLDDVYVLSCSAWLHDWGHVGAPFESWFPQEAVDVRRLHGLLTKELLAPEYFGMHGLERATAKRVGVLSAHHQSWTSFGRGPAEHQIKTVTGAGERWTNAPTLDEDAQGAFDSLASAQLLVALLRLADGADAGVHRVPDLAARDDFRHVCKQRAVLRVAERLRLLGETDLAHDCQLLAQDPDDKGLRRNVQLSRNGMVQRLIDYLEFVDETVRHYRRHQAVSHVDLVLGREGLRARVQANAAGEAETGEQAIDVVGFLIHRELRRPTVREAQADAMVDQVLRRAGIEYVGAYSE